VAGHLGALGFPATTREEFEALGLLAASLGEAVDAHDPEAPARYVRWRAGAGVELWAQADATAKAVRGLTPYFASGQASLAAKLVSVVGDPKRPHDGRLLVVPGNDERRAALAPVPVGSPDFRVARPDLVPGREVELSVAAFAHALDVFPDARKLVASSPAGLTPGLLLAAPQGGLVLGAGIVVDAEERTNESSKKSFGWWLLEVSGGTIDVLVDAELKKPLPKPGEAVRGVFWLCGRVATG
jgi:hypothetical protein